MYNGLQSMWNRSRIELNSRFFGGGDPPSPTANESTQAMLNAYTTGLPEYYQMSNKQMLPNELATLSATQAVSPAYAALADQLYKAYGPSINKTGSDIASQNAMAQAQSDAAIYKGPGQDIARSALDVAKITDPEYYKTRETLGNRLGEMMQPGLTGGEETAISRGVARDNVNSGVGERQSIAQQASNATRYGGAERDRMTQALSLATGALPTLKSGTDVGSQTVGRPTTTNAGDSRLPGAATNVGASTVQQNQNFLNNIAGFQNTAMGVNAQRRDTLDRFNQTAEAQSSSVGNVAGAGKGCCFIFLEIHNGSLPWWVRTCRDAFITEDSRRGYNWMSSWLVPMMKKNKKIRSLVNATMVSPLTEYGGCIFKQNTTGHRYKLLFKTWFFIWTILGRMVK